MHVCERLMYLFMSVCTCSNGTGLARSVHLNQTLALGGSVKKNLTLPPPYGVVFGIKALAWRFASLICQCSPTPL